jgi:hypothetical protein
MRSDARTAALIAATVALLTGVIAVSPARAQGHRGAPPGQINKPKNNPGGSSAPPAATTPGGSDTNPAPTTVVQTRTFGAWLDDASLAPGGSVWITLAATRWSTLTAHGIDAPSLGVAAGLTRRAQLSFAVPYSRMATNDGPLPGGMGDVYAGVKLLARTPGESRVGVSFSPTIEILNPPGGSRSTGLVLPVSAEVGFDRVRVYGSTGFFTRGAGFAAGALEMHVTPTLSVTGALLRSWSTDGAEASDALGLRDSRTDVNGTVVSFLHPSVAVFGSVGRTLSTLEFDSSRYVLSGGIAFVLTPPNETPIRPPR